MSVSDQQLLSIILDLISHHNMLYNVLIRTRLSIIIIMNAYNIYVYTAIDMGIIDSVSEYAEFCSVCITA